MPTTRDADALGLYALMGQDWPQFVRLLPDASDQAIGILYKIITRPDEADPHGTALVYLYANRNGIKLCRN